MYTNIKHEQVLSALQELYNLDKDSEDPLINHTTFIFLSNIIKFCLGHGYFEETTFGSFHQTNGVIMGDSLSKAAANLVGLVSKRKANLTGIDFYRRYVDDLLVICDRDTPPPTTLPGNL